MTTEIIREIIDDIKNDDGFLECEKSDFLNLLSGLYPKESKPFKKEIEKLIDMWD